MLELGEHAQRLRVVVEAAIRLHHIVQRGLARMAEGRVADIVGERQRFGEILVQPEQAGGGARDLADFQRMGQARAVMIAFMGDENLRLLLQAAEGVGVDDAVAVALEIGARGARRLRMEPAARAVGVGCKGRPRRGGEPIGHDGAFRISSGLLI